MGRKPVIQDWMTVEQVTELVGVRPGQWTGGLEPGTPYRTAEKLLNAAGLTAGKGARERYNGAQMRGWWAENRHRKWSEVRQPSLDDLSLDDVLDTPPSVYPMPPVAQPPKPAPAAVQTPSDANPPDALQLAALIQRLASGALDADAVRKIAWDEARKATSGWQDDLQLLRTEVEAGLEPLIKRLIGPQPTRVELHDAATGETADLGVQHASFPTLLQMVAARDGDGNRLNIWLPGPAGSGKTRAAKNAAEALGLPFRFCGALDSAYALLGFANAAGVTVRTQFREAYEHGGVFLFDEVDASDPSAVLALNAALANGLCAFPDAIVPRHPDCAIIAAANTWGHGGNSDYVGRFKQDAAFLSRFVMLQWDYDAALERAICTNLAWCERVQQIRARVRENGINVVISPRATLNGEALLRQGIPQEIVEQSTLRQGMSEEAWQKVSRKW
jgi:hypothetical protein